MEKQLNELIKNFIDSIENVDMIALIDHDGLVLMSMLKEADDDILGAITAAFDIFIDRMKKEFTGSEFMNMMTLGKRKFFFASVGDNAILTVVANELAIESEIRVYSELALSRVSRILAGEEGVSIEIPGIIKIMSRMKVFSRFREGKLPKGVFTIKVILCGDYRVGKTSLIRRFVNDSFQQNYVATIGVDISRREMRFDENCTIKGPVIIGMNCKISGSYIGPYTSIGDKCEIVGTEIEDSVIMDNVSIYNSERIVDSLIGRDVKIFKKNGLPKGKRFVIGDNSEVYL